MKSTLIVIAVLVTAVSSGLAQQPAVPDTLATAGPDTAAAEKRTSTLVLPIFGYTPDTSVMFGALALRFFYLDHGPEARPSVFSPTVIYTAKNQLMIFMGTDFNWGQGRWHSRVGPSYIKFPDQYYGIGRDSDLDDEEDYTPERIAFEAMIEREVVGELRLGASCRVMRHRLLEVTEGGVLDAGLLPGIERTLVSAPGLTLGVDTRDNTWYPTRGVELKAMGHWARGAFGSDYDFEIFEVDLRGYRSLGSTVVLAGQLRLESLEGNPPFFMLPGLGGQDGMRGYRGSLYRDETLAFGRVELRRAEIWRRLGGVLFAGIGDVAPRPDKLTLSKELWTAGFGLRVVLDRTEVVNLRLDFGWGNGDSGFFLSLGEAF